MSTLTRVNIKMHIRNENDLRPSTLSFSYRFRNVLHPRSTLNDFDKQLLPWLQDSRHASLFRLQVRDQLIVAVDQLAIHFHKQKYISNRKYKGVFFFFLNAAASTV